MAGWLGWHCTAWCDYAAAGCVHAAWPPPVCLVSLSVGQELTLHTTLPPLAPCCFYCLACSKHAIVVADKKLGNACTIHETIRVKSAAWDDNGGWAAVGCGRLCPCGRQCCSSLPSCH